MSSPSDTAPERRSAAGETKEGRLPRKRITVITATALSLLEACGLASSSGRTEQEDRDAEKSPDTRAERKNGAGKARKGKAGTTSAAAPTAARDSREEQASDACPAEVTASAPEAVSSRASKGRRKKAAPAPAAVVTAVEAPAPASAPVSAPLSTSGPAAALSSVEGPAGATATASTSEAVSSRAPRSRRKKAVPDAAVADVPAMPGYPEPPLDVPAPAVRSTDSFSPAGDVPAAPVMTAGAMSVRSSAPQPEPVPDAAALAAEADRLAAEYGLSDSGGGLVVLPGDEDMPAPVAERPRSASRGRGPVKKVADRPAPAVAAAVTAVEAPVPASVPVPAPLSTSGPAAALSSVEGPAGATATASTSEAVSSRAPRSRRKKAVPDAAVADVPAMPGYPEPPLDVPAPAVRSTDSFSPAGDVPAAPVMTAGAMSVRSSAPQPEPVPDAAALAAEADRLAAEYGLSDSGGGLVVLPGDEDMPAPVAERPGSSSRGRGPVEDVTAGKAADRPAPAAATVTAVEVPVPASARAADLPSAGEPAGTTATVPASGRACAPPSAPQPGPVPDTTAPTAAMDASGQPPAGMGRREAAFRQWAADMQARFDAGLEAADSRAVRRQDSLVVLPPPSGQTGARRGGKKAAAPQQPRPRTWITRRRSTEPGHEARFEEWQGPARTGSVLEKVFASLGASPEQARLSRLWRQWDEALGPDLAPLARPLGHHEDKLLIGAEDAMLMQELYYMGPEIVRRANAFLAEDFFTAVKVSLMLDHQDLDAPSPVLERSVERPKEDVPAPSGVSLGLMDPESAVARCYARFLGMELPDPRK